jgi:hypothetical protein
METLRLLGGGAGFLNNTTYYECYSLMRTNLPKVTAVVQSVEKQPAKQSYLNHGGSLDNLW